MLYSAEICHLLGACQQSSGLNVSNAGTVGIVTNELVNHDHDQLASGYIGGFVLDE